MTGWEMLASSIVEQAARDYRTAIKTLRKYPESKDARAMVMEIERFFHSHWYSQLTRIDPDYLIERLRKETVK